MPRAEIEKFQKLISKALKKADKEYGFEIMGSFRRGEALSSDIDMVVWHPYVTFLSDSARNYLLSLRRLVGPLREMYKTLIRKVIRREGCEQDESRYSS